MSNGVFIDQSAESLWQEALRELGPEDKAVITNKTTDKTALLEELLSLAESKRDVCLQKRLKYKRGDDEIIIRDQVDKIIAWVQRFKEVGSTAIQYDPVHAALPWAGVVLVLQIACNDSQTFGAMVDGIESISSLIVRCSVIEQLCLSDGNTLPSQNQLRQALVKLYISIMRYLTKARRYFSKRTLSRMVKSAKAQAVHSCFMYVQGEQQIASGAKVKQCSEILSKLEEPMIRCSLQIADLYRQLTRDKRLRAMAWLSTINVRKHHNSEATDYLQGSCSWLFQHAELLSWKRSSTSSIVWLHGIPGCGKTKLVYYTISRLLEEAASVQNSAPVLYFYCARNPAEPKRGAPIEILRSLLKQLAFSHADGAIRDVVAELFEEKDKVAEREGCEIEQLTIEECVSTILRILEEQPATIIIDALDEVDPKKRQKLLSALQRIIRNSSSLVKVMVSSRDDSDLRAHLSNLPNIYIRADDNAQDIRRFTHHYVQQALDNGALLNGVISDDLKANLLEHLDRKAMGMFRWVTVQIDNLCDNRRIKIEQDVREELKCLPETLKASYDQNYERIRQLARPSRLMAERTIKWLMCAQSLMTQDELLPALIFAHENHSLGLSPLAILDTCCNMVIVDNDGFVRFAHLSIREYFEDHDDYKLEDCNATVLHRCLEAYINTSLDWRFHTYHPIDLKIKPYAALHWPHHFRSSRKPRKDDALTMLLERFLFDE
ncbi:hypothetical protein EDB82DRAFT_436112, partial [Fusarium venenatum]|uniref:uncharacterized protein n=1 Tax=Fusarium venenatum TaxID=56646 RepID=UPI001D3B63B7